MAPPPVKEATYCGFPLQRPGSEPPNRLTGREDYDMLSQAHPLAGIGQAIHAGSGGETPNPIRILCQNRQGAIPLLNHT